MLSTMSMTDAMVVLMLLIGGIHSSDTESSEDQAGGERTPSAESPARAETSSFSERCRELEAFVNTAPLEPPVVISSPEPEFPSAIASGMCIKGSVIVAVLIDDAGGVCDVHLIKGLMSHRPDWFDDPVMEAVRSWRFSPARLNGRPVSVVRYLSVWAGTFHSA